jgi:AcrR family transcriptional regulator
VENAVNGKAMGDATVAAGATGLLSWRAVMPTRKSPAPARRYLGVTAAERRAQRRERLLAAGLELFGTRGYAETAVRDVCAAAGLNTRYFYESFKSNEDLLSHVYERIIAEMSASVIEVTADAATIEEQARTGLRIAWGLLSEDPRKARVIAVEVVGASARLERMRRRDRQLFADILVRNALSLADPNVELLVDPVLNARAMIGASTELLGEWVMGELNSSVDEIVDYLVHLYTTSTFSVASRRGASPNGSVKPRSTRKRAATRGASSPGGR